MAAQPLERLPQDGPAVSDELIGRLYASRQQELTHMVADLPPEQRANLAVFCYRRAHLREIGLAIAATCDQWSLVNAAGKAGDVLYAHSRSQPEVIEPVLPYGRRKITLASLVASEGSEAGQPSPDAAFDDAEDAMQDAEAAL
ncbi:MAG: hypothetical protein ACLPKB_13760 [Xanthobacteraceae bacterium]